MSKNQPDTNKHNLNENETTYISPSSHPGVRQFSRPHPFNYGDRPPGAPFGYPGPPNQNLPVPFQQSTPEQGTGSFLDKLPIKDIKGFVDRMGGIEGIMGMVTKVNTMFKSFQQMSPMIKLLLGSFAGKAATAGSGSKSSRRRRRNYSHQRRRSSSRSSGQRSRSGTGRKRSGRGRSASNHSRPSRRAPTKPYAKRRR